MFQAMQDLVGTVITYVIYGVMILVAVGILQLLFSRKRKGKRRGKDKNYSEILMECGDAYVART